MNLTSKIYLIVLGLTILFASVANAAYNAADNAADPAYINGWSSGSNGGSGFGAWGFDKDPSQYAIASSPGIDISNKSWAVTAEYGTSAIRPFAGGNLAVGQTVSVNWTLPGPNADNAQVRLLDAGNNPIINALLSAGYLSVAINNVWGPGANTPWATNGANVQISFTLAGTNAINLTVTSGGNAAALSNLAFTGNISAVSLFVDGPNDPSLPQKTAYFNSLSVTGGTNQVSPPVFNPANGLLTNGQLVTITSATPGAIIHYTTNGSLPTSQMGTLYSGPVPFNFSKATVFNAIATLTGLADSPVTTTSYHPPTPMTVGNNLDAMTDWSTSWPFVDTFKRTRTWMTRNLDGSGAWDSGFGSLVPMDTNGWPTQVPFMVNGTNQMVHTILVNLNEAGTYDFIYEGTGSLLFTWSPGGSAALTATGGVQSFTFTATNGTQATIEIHASAANDYLRNFHLVLTNYLSTYIAQPFDPMFLQRLQPFGCLRFMDWGNLNATTLSSWTNRTTPAYYTQSNPNGVALEYMVQLCNTLQKDAWICIPHLADDVYVQAAAQLIRDNLNPGLRVYVEYSNETWNSAFPQSAYVQAQGVSLNLDPAPYTAGQEYAALRSAQIWNIFQQVFGSTTGTRVVKVLSTQTAGTAVTSMRVAALLNTNLNLTGIMPDALAIAPYFGRTYTPSDLPPNALYPTVDDILTNVSVQAIAAEQTQVALQKAISDANAWRLVCYEGGQTYQGILGAENDANLTAILETANRDPRMGTLYTQYLDMLKAQGVDLFNNYSYCGSWGKYGCWSLLEFQNEPTNAAPKYAAVVNWIAAQPGPPACVLMASGTTGGISFNYGPVSAGYAYTVQYCTDLTTGVWQPVTTLTGWQTNGTQISITDSDATRPRKFYRVQIASP